MNRYVSIKRTGAEMRNLWPSINVIESSLQGRANEPLHFPDKVDAVDHSSVSGAEMPAFLRDKIRQRVASRMARFDTTPKAGQIWRFDGNGDNTSPLSVLLNKHLESTRWQGWLVSPETDYATHQDVLLEPKDEPFDPIAGMVQTWNPVVVDVSKGSRVLAYLSESRLNAIREVAQGQCAGGGGARAGFVAPLKTNSGATVLAGTRIAHPEDPRRQYQTLYQNAAQRLAQQFSPQASAKIIQLKTKRPLWFNVGLSLAASIVLAQAAIIANLMREHPNGSMEEQINKASEFRSVPQAPDTFAYIEVNFKPDAKEIDIRKVLTKLNASIVDGPDEFGQYRVKVKVGSERAASQVLQESGLTDSVIK